MRERNVEMLAPFIQAHLLGIRSSVTTMEDAFLRPLTPPLALHLKIILMIKIYLQILLKTPKTRRYQVLRIYRFNIELPSREASNKNRQISMLMITTSNKT